MAIKTYKQKDMGYSSNFDKLLMWTCTNEQLVSYTWYRAIYLIAVLRSDFVLSEI